MVEENFEITKFFNAIRWLILDAYTLTKAEENFDNGCSTFRYSNLINALKWLIWNSFTFTMIEENFTIIKFFDAIK